MKVTLIPGRELSPDVFDCWRKLQRSNVDLANPYFCPEFTGIVASVRPDVEVAVMEEAGSKVAFLPFQRGPGSLGAPVGGILSDYQGLICAREFSLDPSELVRQSGLIALDFDHLLVSQRSFSAFHSDLELSPQLDLSRGYESYLKQQKSARSIEARTKAIERTFGELRYVAHDACPAALQKILAWKSQQYLRTGRRDLFAESWIRATVERVHAMQTEGFSGMLSLLYFGDQLAAGHLSMRAGPICHYWFPAYDRKFAKYSPGLILLLKTAAHASSSGVHILDLGKGLADYKQRFMNASVPLASGSVELMSWRSVKRWMRGTLRSLMVRASLDQPLRYVVSAARQLRLSALQGR